MYVCFEVQSCKEKETKFKRSEIQIYFDLTQRLLMDQTKENRKILDRDFSILINNN